MQLEQDVVARGDVIPAVAPRERPIHGRGPALESQDHLGRGSTTRDARLLSRVTNCTNSG
jgi:hypothetical protein